MNEDQNTPVEHQPKDRTTEKVRKNVINILAGLLAVCFLTMAIGFLWLSHIAGEINQNQLKSCYAQNERHYDQLKLIRKNARQELSGVHGEKLAVATIKRDETFHIQTLNNLQPLLDCEARRVK